MVLLKVGLGLGLGFVLEDGYQLVKEGKGGWGRRVESTVVSDKMELELSLALSSARASQKALCVMKLSFLFKFCRKI